MRVRSLLSVLWAGLLLTLTSLAFAQPFVLIPDSNRQEVEDIGLRARTHHRILVDPHYVGTAPAGETPASLRAIYGLPSTGGSNVIAVVIAYHYPTALNDFNVFSNTFGLPTESSSDVTASTNSVFQIVYASGKKPRTNAGWAQEAALDIEWAHAMAPSAKIVLVEAASNRLSDLFAAVDVASQIANVKEVTMSWGSGEFSSEPDYDSHFQTSGVVYFASSGDTGGVTEYPSVSPNVVSVGGTSVNRNKSGAFLSETGWSGSGGGLSAYESVPSYQKNISSVSSKVGGSRGVPDVSGDADPYTGVSVYVTTAYQGYSGWLVYGGTSASAPAMAGIINLISTANNSFASSTNAELTRVYSNLSSSTAYAANFRDIVSGSAGGFSCTTLWDFVTGVGSNTGLNGK